MPADRIALATDGRGGWLLQPLDHAGTPSESPLARGDGQLIETVAALETSGAPRWVWQATAAVYPALVRAGLRVGRCHDLHHTEALLLGHEGRRAALATPSSADPSAPTAGQPSLFDAALPEASGDPAPEHALTVLLAAHADQLTRLAAARAASPGLALLVAAESAGALTAIEMGAAGLPWDCGVHDAILVESLGERPAEGVAHPRRPARLQALAEQVGQALEDPGVNVDSPVDLLRALRRAGLPVTSTGRRELSRHDHPVVPILRRYKELARLWTANGWAWQESWVRDGRFHPEYLPAAVVTGRWATRGGGALQIPKAVRAAVCAPPGRVLVVADAGQLEPRVLAALSRDPGMVAATQAGDLYAALADRALGRRDARDEAKVALLSAMYGGGAGSAAMAALRRQFPGALRLLEQAARAGEDGAGVRSVLGRVCPPADPRWLDGLPEVVAAARSRARGRFTRNFVVQASAADWAAVLLAGLRTRLLALPPAQLVFFQHDEVMVEAPADLAGEVMAAVSAAGADATRMVLGDTGVQVPLRATAVRSYADKG